ncbi:hypothetical protein [Caulobacter sp. DWR2-3-1b2]|uniref:hypothetical protein n=1 Tax=Caulobacter sp. DWR2-3-1b2 TaxID=2804642 RepID=UPI003CFBAA41
MIAPNPNWYRTRLLAGPYGAAAMLFAVTWLGGGLIGADTEPNARTWILAAIVVLTFVGWVAAMITVFRRLGKWGLIAAPSALLVGLVATGIPLLAGACALAQACI